MNGKIWIIGGAVLALLVLCCCGSVVLLPSTVELPNEPNVVETTGPTVVPASGEPEVDESNDHVDIDVDVDVDDDDNSKPRICYRKWWC